MGIRYIYKVFRISSTLIGSGQIQKSTYGHLRNNLNLKSQMTCNVARQVSGAYKTFQSQIDKKESEWQLLDLGPTSATFSLNAISNYPRIL